LFRSDTITVFKQVIDDLKDAQASLGDSFLGPERIRANRYAAGALLARVYLYQKNYKDADEQATAVINSGLFKMSEVTSTFTPNNTEAIMQFASPSGNLANTSEGILFIPYATPDYAVRPGMLAAFEANDLRKTNWLKPYTSDTNIWYAPAKYKFLYKADGIEYNIVFRLAEQYLIRAEAFAQQNNLAAAIADLDTVRKRAGLPLISADNPSISRKDLLEAILHERQVELFVEWGHRWFDIKRLGLADAIVGAVKGNFWQHADVWFPVPASELLVAPNL